jgi:hypothetical protein
MLPIVLVVALLAGTLGAQPPPDEKAGRTAAQQKIDSQLLYEMYRARGEATRKHVPPGPTGVAIDREGRALVDIRADPAPRLLAAIRRRGGVVLSTSARDRSILARVPIKKLEALAADPAVQFIAPAPEATTVRQP